MLLAKVATEAPPLPRDDRKIVAVAGETRSTGFRFTAYSGLCLNRCPMKNLLGFTIMFASFGMGVARADKKPLFAPRPVKDAMASKKHSQGAGVFTMQIDKPSGKVKGVLLASSTGDVFLDCDVINTFLKWRFKPNTESFITIVVAFTADKDVAFYPVGRTIHATNRGMRVPFTEPVEPAKLWQQFSEIYGAAGHR